MTIYVATARFNYCSFGFSLDVQVQQVFDSYLEAKKWSINPCRAIDAYEEAHWYHENGQKYYIGIDDELTPNDFILAGYEIRDFEIP